MSPADLIVKFTPRAARRDQVRPSHPLRGFCAGVADLERCLKPGGLLIIRHSIFWLCDAPVGRAFETILQLPTGACSGQIIDSFPIANIRTRFFAKSSTPSGAGGPPTPLLRNHCSFNVRCNRLWQDASPARKTMRND